ncbi:MAG: acyltransferase [Sporolactobacillus sp.]
MKRKHLYEIDLMRAIIMFGVLSVHTMSIFDSQLKGWTMSSVTMSAIHSSMHVTRMAFMFITGFILFIVYANRDLRIADFWKKRFLLIGIPYLFWNIIYLLFQNDYLMHTREPLFQFLNDLWLAFIHGDQFYIYYVLVTFQFYLVFPFMLRGLQKFKKWHLHVFLWSVYVQLITTVFIKFVLPHLDTSSWPYLLSHYGVFVVTYQCYFVLGGLAACHYNEICTFIDRHIKLLIGILAVSWMGMCLHYYLNRVILHESDRAAQSVHQPVYLPYTILIIALLIFIGRYWAKRRETGSGPVFNRFVQTASMTSFGMYLAQPFPLYLVGTYFVPYLKVGSLAFYLSLPLAILFVYAASMLIAYAFYKTPILSYCIGRRSKWPSLKRSKPAALPEETK